MEQNEQLREYLIIKKEAYSWLLWWGLTYLIGLVGVFVLVYNQLPSYNRYFSILTVIMLPIWFVGAFPLFTSKNQIEKEQPELKKTKTTGTKVPMSMRQKRYISLFPALLVIIFVFVQSYQSGMAEKKKREAYEIIQQYRN
ncbi:hypothetical protein [Streptococcus oricebi]|uniref:Uncharacterized protein n=1 Tax=Streptococcus oricebi TaxID=1547447 RepID=A0ABS5B4V3_9STRE|nr:hypothetical protein [Streptococcus oricebi]MBP2623845.1 hypothetical protein [Streptococcus oricebi]